MDIAFERLGAVLIEEGNLLCRSFFPDFDDHEGEQPPNVHQISNELREIDVFFTEKNRRGLLDKDEKLYVWYEGVGRIARDAVAFLDRYNNINQESSSSASRRRGDLQNMLPLYVRILRSYEDMYSYEARIMFFGHTESNNNTPQLQNIRRIVTRLGDYYGIRFNIYDTTYGEKFVGPEGDVELLVEHLVNDYEEGGGGGYRVVSICGTGGLGKSTMARKISKHPRVKRHFSASAYVLLAEDNYNIFNSTDILREILRSLLPPEKHEQIHGGLENAEIIEKLIEVQQNNKCLVVLDGRWLRDDWIYMKDAFPISKGLATKFLITTRNEVLATSFDPQAFIYQPRFLNEEESWELFKHKFNWDVFSSLQERDCKALISGLNQCQVNFVYRSANAVARSIVRAAASVSGQRVWDEIIKMEEMGRNMVSHCLGLPFPIVRLAALLSFKSTFREWEILHQIIKSFMMEGLSTEYGRVSGILYFIYQDLSSLVSPSSSEDKLKKCFLYLRNLPQGYEIDAEKLFQLWIADDVIVYRDLPDNLTLMELAENLFKILELRSMVKVQVDESTGRTKSFRHHEFFQELCLSESDRKNFNSVDLRLPRSEIDLENSSFSNFSLDLQLHRLTICLGDHNDLDNYVPPNRKIAQQLCSELFFLQKYNHRSRISRRVESHLSDLKFVRVLDLGGLVFSKLDRAIGKLIHLEYLGLRYTIFHELPSTIANMKHLQTLDLWDDNTQYASVTIPNVLWKLKQLTHLYLRNLVWSNEERRKLRLDNLENLELIENFDSRVFNVEDLFNLPFLRRLRAKTGKISDLKRITDYLQGDGSCRLRDFSLSIKYCDLYSEEGQSLLGKVFECPKLHELNIDGRTGVLPMYNNNFSPCLTKITLESCELKEDPIATLEKLANLRSLFLKWNAFVGKEMVCSATGFPQLRILQLQRIRNLEKWRVEEGAMPRFSSLEITSCPALEMVPHGLKFVTTLKEVVIKWMPKSFTNKLQALENGKYGDDFYKVQHASIKIIDFDGKEETVHKNTDAATGGGEVIRETVVSPSRTTSHNNTMPDKRKGNAPMTKLCTESSMDVDDDDDEEEEKHNDFMLNEMGNIWQLGFAHCTLE